MKKNKHPIARSAKDLAALLDLDPADAIEMDFRAKLTKKIIEAVSHQKLTHMEVAKRSKASRTRITAILNGNTVGMSTDLLLRILYSLGYRSSVSFTAIKIAA